VRGGKQWSADEVDLNGKSSGVFAFRRSLRESNNHSAKEKYSINSPFCKGGKGMNRMVHAKGGFTEINQILECVRT
jgi:hypothetical protein